MADRCVFCGRKLIQNREQSDLVYELECSNCGRYRITRKAWDDLTAILNRNEYKDKRHLISGYLREMTGRNIVHSFEDADSCIRLLQSLRKPSAKERLDKLLLNMYRAEDDMKYTAENICPALGYATDAHGLRRMLSMLEDEGLLTALNVGSGIQCNFTMKGVARAESLQEVSADTRQVFVAMWFEDSMIDVYHQHIDPAIREAGYEPLIISAKEHNDKICDEIIAEIRRSRFLIADFTGQRGGVYFEAGFALGLGIPVIWTCHKDHFGADQVHFDVNHYNFIVWETGNDLQKQLYNRIRATIT